ncbi:hypothetical protein CC78DRAFT_588030 [Lojkania enalia]|uniref:Uncharacterized protein n=1 Tax=Lojkania enalia TaxID=147567 RepID=A0A9P4N422_9PLEO|nr:hypothetical protein CC78DRAFT_588030 [Didymosphaeria enalia]
MLLFIVIIIVSSALPLVLAQIFLAGVQAPVMSDYGYAANSTNCLSTGTTCQTACGPTFSTCFRSSPSVLCIETSVETCCQPTAEHVRGATCRTGYYCVEVPSDFENGLFCCKNTSTLEDCKVSVIDVARTALPVPATELIMVGGSQAPSTTPLLSSQNPSNDSPTGSSSQPSEVIIIVCAVIGAILLLIFLNFLAIFIWRWQEKNMIKRIGQPKMSRAELDAKFPEVLEMESGPIELGAERNFELPAYSPQLRRGD